MAHCACLLLGGLGPMTTERSCNCGCFPYHRQQVPDYEAELRIREFNGWFALVKERRGNLSDRGHSADTNRNAKDRRAHKRPWPTSLCCGRELVEENNGELKFVYCRTCPHAKRRASTSLFPNSDAAYPDEVLDRLEGWSALLPWPPTDNDETAGGGSGS